MARRLVRALALVNFEPVDAQAPVIDLPPAAVRIGNRVEVDMAARILAGDPFRLARRQRDLAVDRQSELERDPGPAEREPGEPAGERALRSLAPRPKRHRDPGAAQARDALPGSAGVGVFQ